MKRVLGIAASLLMLGGVALAEPHGTFYGQMWNVPVNASTTTYVRDLNLSGEIVSAQINYSSVTIAPITLAVASPPFILSVSSQIIATNSFATGLPVLFTTTATVTGLTSGTTYYASAPLNSVGLAPYFYLSTTYANAVAGTYIQVTATGTVSGRTATFSVVPSTGNAYFVWQESDDQVNWTNLNVSSVTYASNIAPSYSQWDFGTLYGRFLRLVAQSPAAGAINFSVWLNQATSYVGN